MINRMTWQLGDPDFRRAIHSVCDPLAERAALAGTVGVQVHVASIVGLDKLGPPAKEIEIVSFGPTQVPDSVESVPVRTVDSLGFEASVKAGSSWIALGDEQFHVASPEHILGMCMAAPSLPRSTKWACFMLMRACEGRLDLEEVRGFLKRSEPALDRQSLLVELAYLAA